MLSFFRHLQIRRQNMKQMRSEGNIILCFSATFLKSTSKYRVTQKRELLKNPIKIEEIQEKNLLTEIEPLQLAF